MFAFGDLCISQKNIVYLMEEADVCSEAENVIDRNVH
jgi:hypothetical protein